MSDLSNLKAQVAANQSVYGSALTLIQGLEAHLESAGSDPVAYATVHNYLVENGPALAAAVAENTPAAGQPAGRATVTLAAAKAAARANKTTGAAAAGSPQLPQDTAKQVADANAANVKALADRDNAARAAAGKTP
jgi:hypothetical protein